MGAILDIGSARKGLRRATMCAIVAVIRIDVAVALGTVSLVDASATPRFARSAT